MPKPMLKLVRKEEEEDRGTKAPILPAARSGLLLLLRRLGSKSRGYAIAGAGVVAGAVVVVSLLSWLAPDSDRPMASPLEAVGRVASGVLEQVDDQVETLLGKDGETVLRSVREGLTAAGSATPWPSKSSEVAAGPSSSSTASPDSASPSSDDAVAPTRGESPSTAGETPSTAGETPSQPALAPSPSTASETPSPATEAPSPTTGEPAPPPAAPEEPPAVEEPPPPVTEEPPATEEPPPATEEPPPATEEPPPVVTDPAPVKGPPETIADE